MNWKVWEETINILGNMTKNAEADALWVFKNFRKIHRKTPAEVPFSVKLQALDCNFTN